MQTQYSKIVSQMGNHKRVQGIMQYVNKGSLTKQHKLQKTNKATGIDKVTKAEYEENLNENLDTLIARMKKFSYKPQPVRRTYIPKDGSDKMRPLGIPAIAEMIGFTSSNALIRIFKRYEGITPGIYKERCH